MAALIGQIISSCSASLAISLSTRKTPSSLLSKEVSYCKLPAIEDGANTCCPATFRTADARVRIDIMALGLSNGSSGGDFLPIVKWDARAGRFFRVDRSQGANGWESNDVDLTMDKPKFCVDLGSIEVGFMAFLPTGPDFHLTPYGNPMPEKPSKDHKAGFKVRLAGNALNGVREFSSSAKSV